VVNHTVNVGGGATLGTYRAGVRYYALQRALPGGNFGIVEQATFGPATATPAGWAARPWTTKGTWPWATASRASAPSPRSDTAGRLASDPPNGLFQGEQTLIAGSGVQLSSSNRWGDYSGLVVDPVDDCTFWYTNEYYSAASQATSPVGWRTRIGSFKVDPSCAPPPMGTLTGTVGSPIPAPRSRAPWWRSPTDIPG